MKAGLMTKSRVLIGAAVLIAILAAAHNLFGSASNKSVCYTFTVIKKGTLESAILCTGVLSPVAPVDVGILFAVGVCPILDSFTSLAVLISVVTILIAFLFSGAIGMFFGYYPARKAAAMNPIRCLAI